MVNPIPDKVKECLSSLPSAEQVTLRGYIGTLRAEIKELEEKVRALEDPDPREFCFLSYKFDADGWEIFFYRFEIDEY